MHVSAAFLLTVILLMQNLADWVKGALAEATMTLDGLLLSHVHHSKTDLRSHAYGEQASSFDLAHECQS